MYDLLPFGGPSYMTPTGFTLKQQWGGWVMDWERQVVERRENTRRESKEI